MNIVSARVIPVDGSLALSFGSQRLELPPAVAASLADRKDQDVIMGIRPEDLEDPGFAAFDGDAAQLEVRIELVENLGAEKVAHFEVDTPPVRTKDTLELAADLERDGDPGDTRLVARPDHVTFTARLHPRSLVSAGQTTKLAVDASRLYCFDPTTGEAILR